MSPLPSSSPSPDKLYRRVIKDITTTKDGDSFDITRVIMVLHAAALLLVMFISLGFFLYGYLIGKPFDITTLGAGMVTLSGALAAMMMGGGASLWMKKSTEPNGDSSVSVRVTSHENHPAPPNDGFKEGEV